MNGMPQDITFLARVVTASSASIKSLFLNEELFPGRMSCLCSLSLRFCGVNDIEDRLTPEMRSFIRKATVSNGHKSQHVKTIRPVSPTSLFKCSYALRLA